MPSNRRLITRTSAAFVGAAVTALLATPAMACTATLTGTPTCDTETGQVKVTWTITNDYSEMTLKDVTSSPTLAKIVNGATVPAKKYGNNGVLSETVSVKPGTVVSLGFTAKWSGYRQTVPVKTINTTGICKEVPPPPPTKSATPSAQPSASGRAGGGPVSPSASAAAPALPVTGSQTGLYAGGAVVLLGAGAGLFVVARRRRLKFEA